MLFDVCILLTIWPHFRSISPYVEELPQKSILVYATLESQEQFLVHIFAINTFLLWKNIVRDKQTMTETLLNKKQMNDKKSQRRKVKYFKRTVRKTLFTIPLWLPQKPIQTITWVEPFLLPHTHMHIPHNAKQWHMTQLQSGQDAFIPSHNSNCFHEQKREIIIQLFHWGVQEWLDRPKNPFVPARNPEITEPSTPLPFSRSHCKIRWREW